MNSELCQFWHNAIPSKYTRKMEYAPNNKYLGGFEKFDTLKRKMIRTDRGEKYLLGEDYLKVWTWEKFKDLAVQAQKRLNLAF